MEHPTRGPEEPPPGGLTVRPGDTLLVMVKGPLSCDHADHYRAKLKVLLPYLLDVVIVQADALAVYRPDSEATPAYVTKILDAYLTGAPLDFDGARVPDSVQARLGFTLARGRAS